MEMTLTRWWNNKRFRHLLIQVILVGFILAGFFFFSTNTIVNLRRLGVPVGLDFLSNVAGFPVATSLIPIPVDASNGYLLLVGIINTFTVSIISVVIATVVGFIVGIARLSPNPLFTLLATTYVESLRNIPLLLFIVFWYFGVLASLPALRQSLSFGDVLFLNQRGLFLPRPIALPGSTGFLLIMAIAILGVIALAVWVRRRQALTGRLFPFWSTAGGTLLGALVLALLVFGRPLHLEYPQLQGFNFQGGFVILPELLALCAALGLYHAAYIAENVRSGFLSIGKGQWEAATSLGLRRGAILRLIAIPQAMRVIVPPLSNQFLNVVKNSTLAVAIGYPEMVSIFAGTVLNQTGRAIECIFITMLFYLIVSLVITSFTNWYNRRVQVVER